MAHKLPKWFSPYSPPLAPIKPKPPAKTIEQEITVAEFTNGDMPTKTQLLALDFDTLRIDTYQTYDQDCTTTNRLTLLKTTQVEDNNYARNLAYYKESLEKYAEAKTEHKAKLAEWKQLKVIYDKQEAEKQKAADLKRLAELKKKYEAELTG